VAEKPRTLELRADGALAVHVATWQTTYLVARYRRRVRRALLLDLEGVLFYPDWVDQSLSLIDLVPRSLMESMHALQNVIRLWRGRFDVRG
jgi:hypothetical protein